MSYARDISDVIGAPLPGLEASASAAGQPARRDNRVNIGDVIRPRGLPGNTRRDIFEIRRGRRGKVEERERHEHSDGWHDHGTETRAVNVGAGHFAVTDHRRGKELRHRDDGAVNVGVDGSHYARLALYSTGDKRFTAEVELCRHQVLELAERLGEAADRMAEEDPAAEDQTWTVDTAPEDGTRTVEYPRVEPENV